MGGARDCLGRAWSGEAGEESRVSWARSTARAKGMPKQGTEVGGGSGARGSRGLNRKCTCPLQAFSLCGLILPGLPPAHGHWGCALWIPSLAWPVASVCASVARAAQWAEKARLAHILGEKKRVQTQPGLLQHRYTEARFHKGSNSQRALSRFLKCRIAAYA